MLGTRGVREGRSDARALRSEELAWIVLAPCAALTFAGLLALGPALGQALFSPGSETLWPPGAAYLVGHAEPTKQGRYIVALLGPALLAGVLLAAGRRPRTLHPLTIRVLVVSGQALALAFVVVAVLGQNNRIVSEDPHLWPIFTLRTLITAGLLALLPLVLLRWRGVTRRVAALARDTPARRIAALGVAAVCATAWLVTALNTDKAVSDSGSMNWTLDDPFAVLDGRTPLANFHPVYSHLLPYPVAVGMHVFGTGIFAYTILMASISGLTLLAVYAVFRRITRSPLFALCLFLPFLAIGFLLVAPDPSNSGASNAGLFAVWPMRYSGAYVLAWLTARHVDGAAPRRTWALLGVAGLVLLDNTEFGSAAVAATLVALALTQRGRPRALLTRLARDTAIGLLIAAALVSLLTLVRAGELPDFASILEYPRIFSVLGWVAMPMPALGFHLVLYATFVATIGLAAVRRLDRDEDTALTAMLAWSGVFGLIAGGYFLGRSEVGKLIALFSAWGFSLALLTVVVVRAQTAQGWRRPGVTQLMVLVGFGLAICALAQLPSPRHQLRRLADSSPEYQLPVSPFIATHTQRGERVAILTPLSHRTAYRLGLTNVAPYAFLEEMATKAQMRTLLDTLRREDTHAVFLPNFLAAPGHLHALADAGFVPRSESNPESISLWTDSQATTR